MLVVAFAAGALGSCGVAPRPAEEPARPVAPPKALVDDCVDDPTPLARAYHGVAAKARCDREVYTIMGGVANALGVKCEHCHVKDDYAAMTENKRIANWMAQDLVPFIRAKNGKDVWCADCHLSSGEGAAKILGVPRDRGRAIEWMTTHLTERFDAHDRAALRCATCHGANVGSANFEAKVILSGRLRASVPEPPPPVPAASDADAGGPADLGDGGLPSVPDATTP